MHIEALGYAPAEIERDEGLAPNLGGEVQAREANQLLYDFQNSCSDSTWVRPNSGERC